MESFWLTFPLLILVIVWVIWKVFVFKGLRWLQGKVAVITGAASVFVGLSGF